jgi:hypothetical protein
MCPPITTPVEARGRRRGRRGGGEEGRRGISSVLAPLGPARPCWHRIDDGRPVEALPLARAHATYHACAAPRPCRCLSPGWQRAAC